MYNHYLYIVYNERKPCLYYHYYIILLLRNTDCYITLRRQEECADCVHSVSFYCRCEKGYIGGDGKVCTFR